MFRFPGPVSCTVGQGPVLGGVAQHRFVQDRLNTPSFRTG